MCFNERIIFNRFPAIATWSGIEGARDIWRPTNYITVRGEIYISAATFVLFVGFFTSKQQGSISDLSFAGGEALIGQRPQAS